MTPFATRLLDWWDVHGRKTLPWQQQRTPYRVWLSEVMLQQTQVATAIPYYERFLARFPDVQALAGAPQDEVLHLWSGLGYYARARNLHAAAQAVVRDHAGAFPDDLDGLQSLPGIGRSTAAAVLSLAHDARHTILDGNVKRVLARWGGVDGYPGLPAVEKALWALAEANTPDERNADYTQAIMDLGATLCTRTRPACALCPVAADCVARATHRQAQLPAARPAKARKTRQWHALVAVSEDAVWLEPRPTRGIWGGLWSFPELPDESAVREAAAAYGAAGTQPWPPVFHAFTHFDLELVPWVLAVPGRPARPGVERGLWYNPSADDRVGLPAPVERLALAVLSRPAGATP